uniref:Putative secreted protein n=1 Tax=Anopheles darlingi TaxID=43151 RepID=A0A2M4DPF2_ANODA
MMMKMVLMVVVANADANANAAATAGVVVVVADGARSRPFLQLQPPVRGGGTIALRVVRVLRGRQPPSQSSK